MNISNNTDENTEDKGYSFLGPFLFLLIIPLIFKAIVMPFNTASKERNETKAELVTKAATAESSTTIKVTGVVAVKDHANRMVYKLQTEKGVFVSKHQKELDLTKHSEIYIQHPLPFPDEATYQHIKLKASAACIVVKGGNVCIEATSERQSCLFQQSYLAA